MDTHTYPGRGLSLSQLVFALNEELKRTANSPSFTFDTVSQLDRGISTALANVREWRNSFVPINRVPLDVLSLIPTHLHSQPDSFRASHVCRHWRRTLLQNASLWSRLFLPKGEVYVKTLLERAKGSPLDVITHSNVFADTLSLLFPRTQQIRYLTFVNSYWVDVQRFSQANSGLFPLLHTLEISITTNLTIGGSFDFRTPPSLSLFSNAVNLKQFALRSEGPPFLNHFLFPNITTFKLWTAPGEGFRASELLNFLEASPMLQTVNLKISSFVLLEDVAQTKVVVLPNVQTFSFVVEDGEPGYQLASHISCPCASQTSFIYEVDAEDMVADQDIFPTSALWNTLVRQYTKSPVQAVILETKRSQDPIVACNLVFQSSDMSVAKLGVKVSGDMADEDEDEMTTQDILLKVFSQAFRTVRNHPLLSNVKRLRIGNTIPISEFEEPTRMVNEVGRLFKSVGPLDELILSRCDLRPYLSSFLDLGLPELNYIRGPITFPPIKELTILHPPILGGGEYIAAIVELAKSQHTLGIPFERVTIHTWGFPRKAVEMLNPWVGEVNCYEERLNIPVSRSTGFMDVS